MLLHYVILNQPQGSGARPPQAETSNYKQNKSFFSLNSFSFFFPKTWSQPELNELTDWADGRGRGELWENEQKVGAEHVASVLTHFTMKFWK